jgi:zinc protease
MRKVQILVTLLFSVTALAAENTVVDRWANAVGGREKVAAVKSTYREATIEVGGFTGTIKAWHAAGGKYRKEEQVGMYSTVEVFDGTNGTSQQGNAPAHRMEGAELERARSTPFANWNAVFFAFFPERRRGSVAVEGDDTIVMKPEGGIDWRVILDSKSWLPKTMVHKEGSRTITVTFISYETVDGLQFEKEIRRSTGDPHFEAVIRFTKTVINPPLDADFFSIK